MENKQKGLVNPLKKIAGWNEFISNIINHKNGEIHGSVNACKAHLITGLAYEFEQPPIIVTYDEMRAKELYEDMKFLFGEEVYLYPIRDILFYDADVHSMDITAERMRILNILLSKEEAVVIIPIESFLNPLSSKEIWKESQLIIDENSNIDLEYLSSYLIKLGYERVAKVEAIGQFAIRGSIIDIFSPTYILPYRIELWDNEIDSIRRFNPLTQRTVDKVKKIIIYPNQEIIIPIEKIQANVQQINTDINNMISKLSNKNNSIALQNIKDRMEEHITQINEGNRFQGLETYLPYTDVKSVNVIDYISRDKMIYIDEPLKCKEKINRVWYEYRDSMTERLAYGHILPKQIEFIFDPIQIWYELAKRDYICLLNLGSNIEELCVSNTLEIRTFENTTSYKTIDALEKEMINWQQSGNTTIILTGLKTKAERIIDELEERGFIVSYSETVSNILPNQIIFTKGSLNKGFTYEDINLNIVADNDLFGKEKIKKKSKKYKGSKIESFLELLPGDYVVHEIHGIGVFEGIEQIIVEGIHRDNLKIRYEGDSTLYININQMDMIQKYIGSEGNSPKLSKLGTADWKKSKAKVKKAVEDIAKDLINLYSKRESSRGFCYELDNIWQKEFEDLFPYIETEDQLDAIADVKKDMESNKIMDRLICGDVGYGKTEVAIRATFKAIMNKKQVAYLVPTTILAQQHFQRFSERMEPHGIKVEMLSRFRTPKQIKLALKGLKDGTVDIVIGTHRLLSKDVEFKDIGLIIIDEEQRFGVTHKEKLKKLRTEVDALTLTATPIPRTLHMSLIGIRDMSLLEQAPLERRPVQTYVMEYSEDFIKDAINREINRDGQVFFLYNKVKDIEEMAGKIQKLVPLAKVTFAHGQMSERELEQIMMDFINKEITVLVCTTIIETGLDIQNANTIIINDADRMGLSQLYQLRGRVGRSNKIAYAYLMYAKNKILKEIAEKRLQAIKQFTQLGSGFKIAMRDLEIRGAGNLLGAQQHGHMEAIGYELYSKMLKQAIDAEQGMEIPKLVETIIEIKINAFIPHRYILDEMQKLDIYKKISSIQNEKDVMDIEEELEDRYGEIPNSTKNLIDIALLKAFANDLGISKLSQQGNQILLFFNDEITLNPQIIQTLFEKYQ
ncbi:transcription-repair coupling factor, partial [Candidatus Epulonipiscium fishelsonii]